MAKGDEQVTVGIQDEMTTQKSSDINSSSLTNEAARQDSTAVQMSVK